MDLRAIPCALAVPENAKSGPHRGAARISLIWLEISRNADGGGDFNIEIRHFNYEDE